MDFDAKDLVLEAYSLEFGVQVNRAHGGRVPLRACSIADAEAVRASFVRGQEDMIGDLGNKYQ